MDKGLWFCFLSNKHKQTNTHLILQQIHSLNVGFEVFIMTMFENFAVLSKNLFSWGSALAEWKNGSRQYWWSVNTLKCISVNHTRSTFINFHAWASWKNDLGHFYLKAYDFGQVLIYSSPTYRHVRKIWGWTESVWRISTHFCTVSAHSISETMSSQNGIKHWLSIISDLVYDLSFFWLHPNFPCPPK